MKYVIKRLDLNQTPVYLHCPDKRYYKPINVTQLDAATIFSTIEDTVNTLLHLAIHEGQHSLGRVTIVGVKEINQPRYEEVAL